MNRALDHFRSTRFRLRLRQRPLGRHAWLFLLLVGSAACLSEEGTPADKEEGLFATLAPPCDDGDGEDDGCTDGGDDSGDEPPLPTPPPPGAIIATQPNSGWTEGSLAVGNDGAALYDLPLWVPSGRHGMAPTLALHYDSGNGNGLVGVGWSLSGFSSITPCPRTLAKDGRNELVSFSSEDVYCLDGMRLRPIEADSSVEQEYRTERESFSRIVSYVTSGEANPQPAYFKVWTKDGQILTFGNPGKVLTARPLIGVQPENPVFQSDPSVVVAAWELSRIEDRNGNAVDIEYERFETSADMWSVEMRPKQLTYGPDRKVEFVYEKRADKLDGFQPSSQGGIHTILSGRLTTIRMSAGATLLRQYGLTYRDDTITGRSLLTSVTECDGASPAVCLNALNFEWSGETSYQFEVLDTNITDVGSSFVSGFRFFAGDINGNGSDDLIYGDINNNWKMRFSNGSGFGNAQDTGIPHFAEAAAYKRPLRPIDYDRDGKLDLLTQVEDVPGIKEYALFHSTGLAYMRIGAGDFDVPDPIGGDPGDIEHGDVYGAYFVDLDGNGLADYVAPKFTTNNDVDSLAWRYRLNNPTGFGPIVTTGLHTLLPATLTRHQVRAASFDGQVANLLLWNEAESKYMGLEFQNDLLQVVDAPNLPFLKSPENDDRRNLHLADINCDGLQDAVYPYSGLTVQLNSGAGFSQLISGPTDYLRPPSPAASYDLPVRIIDFNGDGCEDILLLHPGQPTSPADFQQGFQVYTWRNGKFRRTALMGVRIDPICFLGSCIGQPIQPLDLNGDGAMDIAQVVASNQWHLQLLRRVGGVQDKLLRVKVAGLGSRAEVDYTTLAGSAHAPATSCSLPIRCPTSGGLIVSAHRVANAMTEGSPWHQFTHKYRGARSHVTLGWLGFEEHEVRDEESAPGATISTNYFDNTTGANIVYGTGSYRVYPFAHVPKKTVTLVDSYPEGSLTTYEYTSSSNVSLHAGNDAPGTYRIQRDNRTDVDRESYGGAPFVILHSRSVTFENYDEFGSPKRITTAVPASSLVREILYQNDVENWLLGLTERRTAKSCATVSGVEECATRTTDFDYYANGQLKEATVEPDEADDSTLKMRAALEYDTSGNVSALVLKGAADGAGRVEERRTSYTYDAQSLFLKKITNPRGHVENVTLDAGLGVLLDHYDANSVPTTMKYDRFGRLREMNYANGYFERYTTSGPLIHKTIVPNGLGSALESSSVTLDPLGRERSYRTAAFGGGFNAVDTVYDRRGRPAKVSRPYLESSGPEFYATFSYDNRHRLLKVEAPDGVTPDGVTVRHEYIGLEAHTHDAKGIESIVVERTDGRIGVRNEDDPRSTSWLRTRFEYGPFGAVRKVTAVDDTVQVTEYDRLGRPIKHIDPSAGVTTASYNSFGEIIKTVDGTGGVTTTDYDALGRPTVSISPDGQADYTWDPSNGLGMLAEAKTPEGVVTTYQYNARGQATMAKWSIESVPYEVNVDYDAIGQLNSVTYPKIPGPAPRLKVRYTYRPGGFLDEVQDAQSGARYWRPTQRNAAGQLVAEGYGVSPAGDDLLRSTRTYQPETGLLTGIDLNDASGLLLDRIAYEYDLNRNVTARSDLVGEGHRKQTFLYDSLDRLDIWTVWKPGGVQDVATDFDYNKIGNLLSETVTGRTGRNVIYRYGQNGAPTHALTSRGAQAYTYDGAGRQTTGPDRTIAYTTFGLPKSLTKGGGQTTLFAYDAAGTRVLKRNDDATVISIAGLFERRNPAASGAATRNVHYITADGQAIAQVTLSQAVPDGDVTQIETLFLHRDAQGSVIQTTTDGQVVEEFFYHPFGQRVDRNYDPVAVQSRPVRRGYSGHEHDDDLDLINMQGRVYDPVARSFLSPDPFIQAPLFSQSHNRYSYVWNNPATSIDPTGFSMCDIICVDNGWGDESGGGGGGGGGSGDGDGFPGDGGFLWPSGSYEPEGSSSGIHPTTPDYPHYREPHEPGPSCPLDGGACYPQGPTTDDTDQTHDPDHPNGNSGSGGGVPPSKIPIDAGQEFWWPVALGVPGAELTDDAGEVTADWVEDQVATQLMIALPFFPPTTAGWLGFTWGALATTDENHFFIGPPGFGGAGGAARETASSAGRIFQVGEVMPGGGIAGVGPGAAARIGSGNLKNVSKGQLRRLGIDAEAMKADFVGAGGGRFNIAADQAGKVFLTPVRKGNGPPVETGLMLDELSNLFPGRR